MINNPNQDRDQLKRKYELGEQSHTNGNRSYGMGGAPSPHVGGGLDKSGYRMRDQKAKQKKDFLYSRLKTEGF